MKKFNSFLMVAAVALTSVFGFTSCDKNDDAFIDTTVEGGGTYKPESKKDSNYQLFLSNEVLDLGDVVVTVEGQDAEYKASQAPSTSTTITIDVLTKKYEETFYGRTITVSNIKPGSKVTAKFIPNEEAIAALPADGVTRGAIARYLSGGENSKMETPLRGVMNSMIESRISRQVADYSHTFNK